MSDSNDECDALEAPARRTRLHVAGAVHQEHEPRPLVVLNPDYLRPAVLAIKDEIKRLQRCGAGSYLYVDEQYQVFIVSELRSVAGLWVKRHFGWLVAFYAPRTKKGSKKFNGEVFLQATEQGITEDLEAHLADLSRPQPELPTRP